MKENMDPRMHSAEHILNQTMVRLFDCGRCFRAHIERKKSKCDYLFERPLSNDEVRLIQERVNEIIRADLPVTEEFQNREALEKEFNLERLPADAGEVAGMMVERGMAPGLPMGRFYPEMDNYLLVAVTEKRTKYEIGTFAETLESVLRR